MIGKYMRGQQMKIGSLFAGIGGFDLGFERQGFECAWQCEIDKYANQVLEKHWPEVKRYNDIRKLTNPEYVDVICGGFPCQDLSVAGNRAGLSGQRSGLFFELARIIDEVKPKWFVLENVPGLLSSKGGQDMQTVLETLAELGYYVAYRVLDSQNFGVAQRRKRVFFVGSLGNASCAKVLFEPESIGINISQGGREGGQDAQTVGSLAARDSKGIGTTIDGKLVTQDQGGSVINFGYDVVGTLRREEHGHNILILDPHTQGEPRVFYDKCPTLNTNQGGQRQPCIAKTANTKANGNNISTKGISYTLDGSVNQAVVQDKIRRLTPIEYERLQGFPDNWTNNLSDTQRYKTLGNAVTVNAIEWIAKRIKDIELESI